MNLRKIIKIISVVFSIITGLTLLFFISKDQLPIFLPNQKKEIKVKLTCQIRKQNPISSAFCELL